MLLFSVILQQWSLGIFFASLIILLVVCGGKINMGLPGKFVTLHYITFYLADAFIQSDVQSCAIQVI